ncbi:Ribonuclease H [Yarrowia sp. C11]|nr:Ribonuclease H [Yarrowia sp. C11]KAG5364332.1 Ribonuclease H [Yarrowia sp. E02]
MKNYYVVKVGHRPGIYENYSDARDQIEGVSGAVWRGFNDLERAREYWLSGRKAKGPKRNIAPEYYVLSGTIFSSYKLAKSVSSGRYPLYECATYEDALYQVRMNGYSKAHKEIRQDLSYVDSDGNTVYEVYTDGACSRNGRPDAVAGYSVFFGLYVPGNTWRRLKGPVQTNQRAELSAILKAYQIIDSNNDGCHYEINTDSAYALNCILVWSKAWRRNGWINSKGQPVANRDLIQAILSWASRPACRNVTLHKVPAHEDCEGNNSADTLARRAVDPTDYVEWLEEERYRRDW